MRIRATIGNTKPSARDKPARTASPSACYGKRSAGLHGGLKTEMSGHSRTSSLLENSVAILAQSAMLESKSVTLDRDRSDPDPLQSCLAVKETELIRAT
jgi:hypothetical protein